MDLVVIALVCIGALMFFFAADRHMDRVERRTRGCEECGFHPDDIETHNRLVHAPRTRAPEDTW